MDDIRIWFNGKKEYSEGVRLYLKHGRDPILLRLFTSKEAITDFKKQKLQSSLDALLISPKKPAAPPAAIKTTQAVAPQKPEPPAPVIEQPEKRWRQQRDQVEESLYQQWRPLYQEMMNLVARVGDIARRGLNQQAGRMALQILELDDQCDAIYYNRDFYIENKHLPADETPIELSLDPKQWSKKLDNHQRYVRKFLRDLELDPSNTDKAALLKKHEWAVSKYKELLNMDHAL